MILRPKLNKIPGELIKTKADKYIQDLTKLTKVQLLEIKEREEKLLSKRSQLIRLPDKGEKIKKFYVKVLKELSQHDDIDKAARLFSELNIAETGQEKLNNLEWTGKLNMDGPKEVILDSDDEETNPLKIIAQSTNMKKHIKYIEPETLVTEEDLREIEEMKKEKIYGNNAEIIIDSDLVDLTFSNEIFKEKMSQSKFNSGSTSSSQYESVSSNSSLNLEPHMLYLFEKEVSLPNKKFLPHKTTKNNDHDPQKEKGRRIGGKYWEITAATPPPIQNSGAQLLSLKDSVEIQTDYLEKLQKMQEKQAAERLAAKEVKRIASDITLPDEQIRKVNKFFGSYRHHNLSSDESDNEYEHEEIYDSDEGVRDDEVEKGGCVNFKVYE